jgi:hypothetical protein
MKNGYIFAALMAILVVGCEKPAAEPTPDKHSFTVVVGRYDAVEPYTGFSGGPVLKIKSSDYTLGDGIRGVKTLFDLNHHSVFLVKVNRSDVEVGAHETGWAYTFQQGAVPSSALSIISGPIPAELPQFQPVGRWTLKDHPEAMAFNNSPAPAQRLRRNRDMGTMSVFSLEDTRNFWVQDENKTWVELPATFRAESAKAKVWIADASYSDLQRSDDNFITTGQAQKIADKFDLIYGHTTEIFGQEPGGPGTTSPGGIDGDEKIHILVYDIGFDQGTQNANMTGFFWAKDLYTQADIDHLGAPPPRTNLAEMFYLDAEFTDSRPEEIYSTLIHEFQHMISYHEKQIVRGLSVSNNEWYTEMMAMLAEDLIAPKIGIAPGNPIHPASGWAIVFSVNYSAIGVNRWNKEELLLSYAAAYSFGAYLVRNFGGAALVKEMASNNYMDAASVDAALTSSANPVSGVRTWKEALDRYGEALIYGNCVYPSDRFSFNRTSETIANYPFFAFNLWSQPYQVSNIANFPAAYWGPLIFDLEYGYPMEPNSLILQSRPEWQNVSGDLEVQVYRPDNPNIDLYIMVR